VIQVNRGFSHVDCLLWRPETGSAVECDRHWCHPGRREGRGVQPEKGIGGTGLGGGWKATMTCTVVYGGSTYTIAVTGN